MVLFFLNLIDSVGVPSNLFFSGHMVTLTGISNGRTVPSGEPFHVVIRAHKKKAYILLIIWLTSRQQPPERY